MFIYSKYLHSVLYHEKWKTHNITTVLHYSVLCYSSEIEMKGITLSSSCHGPQDTGHKCRVFSKSRVFISNKQVEDLQNRAKQRAMKILRHSPQ